MLWLSEVIMERHDLESFQELQKVIVEKATQGEMFFRMDVRPPYADTPEDWEEKLEVTFSSAGR
jgi:predicted lipid-binding transport protein (Tim44 family)